ncbi:MAG: hypothetical protein ACI4XP_04725 [Acutalibacteraceae bacterium]
MTKRKHGVGFFIGMGFLILFIALIIWLLCCLTLIFKDDYSDKYMLDKTDDTLITDVFTAALFGSDFDVTEDQLNTYADQNYCSTDPEKSNAIEHIRIYFHKDQPSEIYAKIRLYSYELAFYTKAEFSFQDSNNILSVKFSNAKLGELPVPDFILSSVLAKISENQNIISVSGTTISVKATYNYDIADDYTLTVSLMKFVPQEKYVNCRTNSLTDEALNLLKKYLTSNEGKKYLKELFDTNIDLGNII